MNKSLKKLFGVKTLHQFGIVDTQKDKDWTHKTTVDLESFEDAFYLRLTVDSKAKSTRLYRAFPIKYSTYSINDLKPAIKFLKQFEDCWQGKIGDPDSRGCISLFIDEKICKSKRVGQLDNLPSPIDDISYYKLRCVKKKYGEDFHLNQYKKGSDSILITIPRPSLSKIIKCLSDYKK